MISNPLTGLRYFLSGFSLLNQAGVRRYVIIPLLINMLIFTLLIWLLSNKFGQFVDWLLPTLPNWMSWLSWLFWLLFSIAAAVILFFGFSILANLVGAPFNSYLSAAVEEHLTGRKPESNKTFLEEARDAILGELRKLLYFIAWAIPLLLIGFIPGINVLSPFLWAIFGAWMLAVEYADYPFGNRGKAFPEIRKRLRQKRVMTLGFGVGVTFATLIPLFNFLVMPMAVAGATMLRVEEFPITSS